MSIEPLYAAAATLEATLSQATSYRDAMVGQLEEKATSEPVSVPDPNAQWAIDQLFALAQTSQHMNATSSLVAELQQPGAVEYIQEQLTALVRTGAMTPDDLVNPASSPNAEAHFQAVMGTASVLGIVTEVVSYAAGGAGIVLCVASGTCEAAGIVVGVVGLVATGINAASTVVDQNTANHSAGACTGEPQYPDFQGGGNVLFSGDVRCGYQFNNLSLTVAMYVNGGRGPGGNNWNAATGSNCSNCSYTSAQIQTYAEPLACYQTGVMYTQTYNGSNYTSDWIYSQTHCGQP